MSILSYVLLSVWIFRSITANSMSGTFQSCTLQCDGANHQFAPVRQAKVTRGKQGPRGESGIPGPKGEAGQSCDVESFNKLKKEVEDLGNEKNNLEKKLDDYIFQFTSFFSKDCGDIKKLFPNSTSGIYTIYSDQSRIEVFCEFDGSDLSWIVFQRRIDGSTDFNRNFLAYTNGFGNQSEEFWLGLQKLHILTKEGDWELQVDLEDFDGNTGYARYGSFKIGEGPGFILTVSSYSGTAGDSLQYHNGRMFSSPDQESYSRHCASEFTGSWWHKECHLSNLNSFTYGKQASSKGLCWYHFHGSYTPLKSSTMKLRKKSN